MGRLWLWGLVMGCAALDTAKGDEAVVRTVAVDRCEGLKLADRFQLPVGDPPGEGYYDAQRFGKNRHLGGDWNGEGGGNTDLGDPVYAAASGRVTEAAEIGGGWGRVLRIAHATPAGCVETLYAHLESFERAEGELVGRGDRLGTIGTANGQYWAHLHFELRTRAGAPLGQGYGVAQDHVDPTAYIEAYQAD